MHGLDGPLGVFLHFLVAEADAAHQIVFQVGNDRILPDVPDAEDTGGPALLGEQGKAVFNGLPGGPVPDDPAMELDGAARLGHGAEQILQHLGTAGAVQAGDAQDLPLAELEGCVL